MNPYKNKHLLHRFPFAEQTVSDIPRHCISWLSLQCTYTGDVFVSSLTIKDNEISAIVSDDTGVIGTFAATATDTYRAMTNTRSTGDIGFMLAGQLSQLQDAVYNGRFVLDPSTVHRSPVASGYRQYKIGATAKKLATVVSIYFSGLLAYNDLTVTRGLEAPAYALCSSDITGTGVTSVNGISGQLLNITAQSPILLSTVTVTPAQPAHSTLDELLAQQINRVSPVTDVNTIMLCIDTTSEIQGCDI